MGCRSETLVKFEGTKSLKKIKAKENDGHC